MNDKTNVHKLVPNKRKMSVYKFVSGSGSRSFTTVNEGAHEMINF